MRKIPYILFAILFSAAGCSDEFLDRLPLDQITDETFWKTEEQLILAVNGCYGALKGKNTIDM